MEIKRCDWANHSLLEQKYHDEKWGIPISDDKELFKMLCLEGMQAGLSWSTILQKMDGLCKAFDNFDPDIVVNYDEEKEAELLQNKEIIRNRLKVKSVANNAKAYFKYVKSLGRLATIYGDLSIIPQSLILGNPSQKSQQIRSFRTRLVKI